MGRGGRGGSGKERGRAGGEGGERAKNWRRERAGDEVGGDLGGD